MTLMEVCMSKPAAAKRYTFPSPMSVGIALTALIRAYGYHCHSPEPYSAHSCTYFVENPHDAADTGGYTITRKTASAEEYLLTIHRATAPHMRTLIERARNEAAAQSSIQIVSSRRTKTQAAA